MTVTLVQKNKNPTATTAQLNKELYSITSKTTHTKTGYDKNMPSKDGSKLALCGRLPCLDNSVVLICSTIQSKSAPYRHLAVASRAEAACNANPQSLQGCSARTTKNCSPFHSLLLQQLQMHRVLPTQTKNL